MIEKEKYGEEFDDSVRSDEKGRALGVGVRAGQTYLDEKGVPFEGLLSQ